MNLLAPPNDLILKVARTITVLDASDNILPEQLEKAIKYMSLDREKYRV